MQAPPTGKLRDEERELMWKFRYTLTSEKKALTKLLKCVDWGDQREVHAPMLLPDTSRDTPPPSFTHGHLP